MLLKSNFYIKFYNAELFIHDIKKIYIIIYMNNIHLYNLRIEDLNWIKIEIAVNYKIKNISNSNCYLDMKIEKNINLFILFQSLFIKNFLKKFLMNDCHFISIFMKKNVGFMNDDEESVIYTMEFTLHFY